MKVNRILYTIAGVILLIAAWNVPVLTGRFERTLLPSLPDVISGMQELIYDGTLFTHIGVSLYRFALGYLTAALAGIILGLILGRVTWLWGVVDPVIQLLRPISPIA